MSAKLTNKTISNKIGETNIKYDVEKTVLYINNIKIVKKELKYNDLCKKFKNVDVEDLYDTLVGYCYTNNLIFDSKQEKEAAKAKEKQEREAAKQLAKQEKEAAKQAEKEAKEAERQESINTLRNIVINEYEGILSWDGEHVRRGNKKLYERGMCSLRDDIKSKHPDLTTCLNQGDIVDIITDVARKYEYCTAGEGKSFEDCVADIEDNISENGSYWEMYMNDVNNSKTKACAIYLLFGDLYYDGDNKFHHFRSNRYTEQTLLYNDELCKYKLINDADIQEIKVNLPKKFFPSELSNQQIRDAVTLLQTVDDISFNEFRDQFIANKKMQFTDTQKYDKFGWDGEDRLHTALIKFFNLEDNDFHRNFLEYMFMQVFKSNDYDLYEAYGKLDQKSEEAGTRKAFMFFGGQGCGKTTFIRKIFGYTCYQPNKLKDNEMELSYSLAGKYCCLWDELVGWHENEAPISDIKKWITNEKIVKVQKYNAFETTIMKTWIDVCTSNEASWYNDDEYERRFVTLILPDNITNRTQDEWEQMGFDQYYIDQMWMQACKLYAEHYVDHPISFTKEFDDINKDNQIRKNKIMCDPEADCFFNDLIDNIRFVKNFYDSNEVQKLKAERANYYRHYDTSYMESYHKKEFIGYNPNGVYLDRIDDYMFAVINDFKRKSAKIQLLLTYKYKWEKHQWVDDRGTQRWYYTRPGKFEEVKH